MISLSTLSIQWYHCQQAKHSDITVNTLNAVISLPSLQTKGYHYQHSKHSLQRNFTVNTPYIVWYHCRQLPRISSLYHFITITPFLKLLKVKVKLKVFIYQFLMHGTECKKTELPCNRLNRYSLREYINGRKRIEELQNRNGTAG